MTDDRRFLRVADVARLIGYTVAGVRRLIRDEVIPREAFFQARKHGDILFYPDRLHAWIESRSGAPAAPPAEGAKT